jgi:pre-mRNA-splicing factor 38B
VKAGGGCIISIGQMLRQWLIRIEYVHSFFSFSFYLLYLRWYDTLFPRIPVPTQKDITERLHAHGPYRGDHNDAHSRYVRWKVS